MTTQFWTHSRENCRTYSCRAVLDTTKRRNKRPNLLRCLGHPAALIDIWRQGRCELSMASICCRVGFRRYNRDNISCENVSIFESGGVLYDKMTTGSLIGAESVILLFPPVLLLSFVLSCFKAQRRKNYVSK